MAYGNLFYFAYGSNMNPARIRARLPEARPVGKAYLCGWRLRERLYAGIQPHKGGRVEGVLYLVTQTELRRLDAYEGYPRVYRAKGVLVHIPPSSHDTPEGRVVAMTYMMTEETRKEREGKPYPDDYRILCSVGARYWGVKDAFGAPKTKSLVGRWFQSIRAVHRA